VVSRGQNHINLIWNSSKYTARYNIFLNGKLYKSTFNTNCCISGINNSLKNLVEIRTENSIGKLSKKALPIEIAPETAQNHIAQLCRNKNCEELKMPSISQNTINQFIVMVDDTSLYIVGSVNYSKGFLNISVDPDNSKCETFSIEDRLYYTSIESSEIKERLDRVNYIVGVQYHSVIHEDSALSFSLRIPFRTLGKKLEINDVFGLKAWVSNGASGYDVVDLILGDTNLRNNLFPESFADVMVK
jgi:hypothetical protein